MRGYGLVVAAGVAALLASPASARTYEVKMLNKGSSGDFMVFEPAYLKIAPGDLVTFTPANPGHDAASLPGMIPGAAAAFAGKINQALTVKFTAEGLYAYECTPHLGMGMVGLIQVGKPVNKAQIAAAAAKLPGLARTKMAGLVAGAR